VGCGVNAGGGAGASIGGKATGGSIIPFPIRQTILAAYRSAGRSPPNSLRMLEDR